MANGFLTVSKAFDRRPIAHRSKCKWVPTMMTYRVWQSWSNQGRRRILSDAYQVHIKHNNEVLCQVPTRKEVSSKFHKFVLSFRMLTERQNRIHKTRKQYLIQICWMHVKKSVFIRSRARYYWRDTQWVIQGLHREIDGHLWASNKSLAS